MRIAELALQGTRREQAARAARGKQQRNRFGTEVDRERAVAPQSCLGGDIGNVASPCIRHGLDTVGAHHEAGRIDLGRSFRDLDLGGLHVADLCAVIGGGAMPRDPDIIVVTGLRVAEAYSVA